MNLFAINSLASALLQRHRFLHSLQTSFPGSSYLITLTSDEYYRNDDASLHCAIRSFLDQLNLILPTTPRQLQVAYSFMYVSDGICGFKLLLETPNDLAIDEDLVSSLIEEAWYTSIGDNYPIEWKLSFTQLDADGTLEALDQSIVPGFGYMVDDPTPTGALFYQVN